MLSLQECLENIKNAVLGRDVRQSIHDGIKGINDESKADMEAKQAVIDTYTAKQDALDEKYDRLLDEMSQANPSLAEVVDARQNEAGTVFTNLRERLNDADQKQTNSSAELSTEINNTRADLDMRIEANQALISQNQTRISTMDTNLTNLRNDVNSYKTTTNNRLTNLENDSGWKGLAVNTLAFSEYSSGSGLSIRNVGKIVNITGALTSRNIFGNASVLDNGAEASLLLQGITISENYRPKIGVVTIHQGSGKAIFMTQVSPDGTIKIGRYREGNTYPSTLPENVWLPINIMYIAK
nr:MAG TPA: hypothetical protein [Caudoviricetes sp.]